MGGKGAEAGMPGKGISPGPGVTAACARLCSRQKYTLQVTHCF